MSLPEKFRAMLSAIIGEEYPALSLAGPWTYRVTKVTTIGGYPRCDLAPVEGNRMQALAKVDQWPGVGGAVVTPQVGAECLVEFRDGLKDRPIIRSWAPLRSTLGKPDAVVEDGDILRLGPSASLVQIAVGPSDMAKAVARIGDTVSLGYLTGAIPGVGAVNFTIVAVDPDPAPSAHLVGEITSGSAKVKSG